MLGYGLGTGIEAHTVFTKNVKVTAERFLVTGEGEIRRRHRNTNIDSNHSTIGEELKLAGIIATLSENHRSVCKRVCVHNTA